MTNTINAQLLNQVQSVMLAKKQQVIVDFLDNSNTTKVGENARLALTLQANLEAYGYGFSIDMLKALSNNSEQELTKFNQWFTPVLAESLGAHRQFQPMYPNFPKQVFEASRAELIINAILHYTGDVMGMRIMPQYQQKARLPLDKTPINVPYSFLNDVAYVEPLKIIKAGSVDDVKELFVAIANTNTSLSASDKEAFTTLFNYFHANGEVTALLNSNSVKIAQKETLAFVAKLMLENKLGLDSIAQQFATSTDVLRVAVALSNGDVSLAAPTKFEKFGRPTRKAILGLLENVVANADQESVIENMFQKRSSWLRLGEKLHPTEYKNKFPLSAQMFHVVRNEDKPLNFNGKIDISLENKDFGQAIELLQTRPGIFARSLNRLLQRIEGNPAQVIVKPEPVELPKFNNMFSPPKKVEEPLPPNNPFGQLKGKIANPESVEQMLSSFDPKKHGGEVMADEPVGQEVLDQVKLPEGMTPEMKDKLIGDTVRAFAKVANKVSTPVLLQVYNHFKNQSEVKERVFLPKGALAKSYIVPNTLTALNEKIAGDIAYVCQESLIERFKQLPALGNVYIDPALQDQHVPFAMRSASKALKTVARGSQIDIAKPGQDPAQTTRFFLWWQDMPSENNDHDPYGYYNSGRVDIDLSVVFLNEQYKYVDHCSFTNLKGKGFAHSGDITSAPQGACEFIDINKSELDPNVQYAVMVINSYTNQPYFELPECFAGWMERDRPQTGEVYEPRTVQNKFDLTSDSQTVLPMIVDVKNNKVIWADLAVNQSSYWNMVEGQSKVIEHSVKAMVNLSKPNLYDLFEMHALARGSIVDAPEKAETVFSMHEGITPYDYEKIASDFMADQVETPKPKKKM
jgi:stress response protein SCP2